MANIIGAIASSHTPTIGFALDANKQHDAVWAPIFKAYEPVQQWLADKKPDVLLMIFNDHVTSFFFDHYSAFALGIGNEYRPADEGGGARDLPAIAGHTGLAQHIGQSLMADEFDMSFFQDKPLDHGCFSPLSIMWPHDGQGATGAWPGSIVPLTSTDATAVPEAVVIRACPPSSSTDPPWLVAMARIRSAEPRRESTFPDKPRTSSPACDTRSVSASTSM